MFSFHRWDEWVPVGRLLKFNETNVALQKALLSQASQAASSSAAGSKKGAGGSGSGGTGGGAGPGTGRGGRKDGRGTKRSREEVRHLGIWVPCVWQDGHVNPHVADSLWDAGTPLALVARVMYI